MRRKFKVRAAVRVGVVVDEAAAPIIEEREQEVVNSVEKARAAVDEERAAREVVDSVVKAPAEVGPN